MRFEEEVRLWVSYTWHTGEFPWVCKRHFAARALSDAPCGARVHGTFTPGTTRIAGSAAILG